MANCELGPPCRVHDCVLSSKSEGISGSVTNCKLIEIQNIKIFASTNWDFSSNFYFLFEWNSPRIEQSNCCWPNSLLSEWPNAGGVSECERKEIRRERESWTKLYLFSFSDHIWSLSRADAWIAAVETDVWPPWGNFIEKFQNNTASTLPFVFASKHFVVYILSAKTRI